MLVKEFLLILLMLGMFSLAIYLIVVYVNETLSMGV